MYSRKRNHTSSHIAKDRLLLITLSDEMNCTPHITDMMKNDLVKAISKYFQVYKKDVQISWNGVPSTITVTFSIQPSKDTGNENAKAI